jgi:hypothetical protein
MVNGGGTARLRRGIGPDIGRGTDRLRVIRPNQLKRGLHSANCLAWEHAAEGMFARSKHRLVSWPAHDRQTWRP